MTTMTLEKIEVRIAEVTASFERQLSLSGKPGYDRSLIEFLKRDLDWLQEQKNNLQDAAAAGPK